VNGSAQSGRSQYHARSGNLARVVGADGDTGPASLNSPAGLIGKRFVVDGMTGAGKSTFSRALAAKTGLPLIYPDLLYWKPGWSRPTPDEWSEKQREVLAGDAWIADGNYPETLPLRLERADTIVVLDTPWWQCAARAFKRGIRRPAGTQMPDGCGDSAAQRLGDEWRGALKCCRSRQAEATHAITMASQHGAHVRLYVLRSKQQARDFLARLGK
jgi:adenylate kinase family enzyme